MQSAGQDRQQSCWFATH